MIQDQQQLTAQQQLQLSTVTVDLPSAITNAAAAATDENGGVLLCNLDELSRYQPK